VILATPCHTDDFDIIPNVTECNVFVFILIINSVAQCASTSTSE